MAYLIHENDAHDPKTGRFTFKNTGQALNTVSSGIGKVGSNLSKIPSRTKPSKKIDLSNVSDKDLQTILNRKRMEDEYNRYFNTPVETNGQKFLNGVTQYAIPIIGAATGLAGTALAAYSLFKPNK
jgi:hypothetical protein